MTQLETDLESWTAVNDLLQSLTDKHHDLALAKFVGFRKLNGLLTKSLAVSRDRMQR